MGYTQFTVDLISKHLEGVKSVLDFGSQNIYAGDYDTSKPPFASEWYKSLGIEYDCIDLAGDNNAFRADLAYPIDMKRQFDLVVDGGTSEHCVQMTDYETVAFHEGHINSIYPKGEIKSIEQGYYNCWLNKFNLCKAGGLIISENPLTGHWPSHGYSYLGPDFYKELCKIADLELIEDGVEAALGNTSSGMNVYGVVRKTGNKFLSFEEFQTLPIYKS